MSWKAKYQHFEVRNQTEKIYTWCWRFSEQDINTKIESINNFDANEQNEKICFDSSDLQSKHCN